LFKVHKERGTTAKVEGTPHHCFIFNELVNGVSVPEELDKSWYIDVANKRINDFMYGGTDNAESNREK